MKLLYKGSECGVPCICSDTPQGEYQWRSPNLASDTSGGYLVTASSSVNLTDHAPYKAFDTSPDTAWHSARGVSQWLKIVFPEPRFVKGIRMTPFTLSTYPYPSLMPSDFTIVGVVDGVSVDIMSVTGASGYEIGEWKEFMFSSAFEVSSITINVSDVPATSKDGVVIGEVEFFAR